MNTRSRSGSLQFDDVKQLFKEFEDRITQQLSTVILKMHAIEKSIESIQANQVRLDDEVVYKSRHCKSAALHRKD